MKQKNNLCKYKFNKGMNELREAKHEYNLKMANINIINSVLGSYKINKSYAIFFEYKEALSQFDAGHYEYSIFLIKNDFYTKVASGTYPILFTKDLMQMVANFFLCQKLKKLDFEFLMEILDTNI